jgi:hypothetical protein
MLSVVQGIPRQARDDNGAWDDRGIIRSIAQQTQKNLPNLSFGDGQVLFFLEI